MRAAPKKKEKPRSGATVIVGPASEWTDFHGILLLFGLRRSLIYYLLNTQPELRGASITLTADKPRGKRLFHVPSFRAFMEARHEQAKAKAEQAAA